jgi:hypothetical protein
MELKKTVFSAFRPQTDRNLLASSIENHFYMARIDWFDKEAA